MCILYTIWVYIYIPAWALLFILIGRFTRAKIQRMSKDKGSTLVFMYGLVGTAARKNIKHNEQTIYLVYMSAVQFSAHGRPTDGSAPVLW